MRPNAYCDLCKEVFKVKNRVRCPRCRQTLFRIGEISTRCNSIILFRADAKAKPEAAKAPKIKSSTRCPDCRSELAEVNIGGPEGIVTTCSNCGWERNDSDPEEVAKFHGVKERKTE